MKNWNYIDGAKTGNAVTDKEFKSEADLRRWCMEHNYTYTPVGGGYYRLEDDKPGSRRADIEAHVTGNKKTGNADLSAISKHWSKATIDHILQNAHVFKKEVVEEAKRLKEAEKNKTGNSKACNADVVKDGDVWVVLYAEGTKSKEFNSEAEAKRFAAQVGNDTPAEYFSKKPKVIGNDKTGVEGFFKKLADDVKDREKKDDKEIKLVGNEASDDKFAYVMREFDEGKLKTPDGKVVTDPAQAKAIAYSESKKTENGLARARNAIKKY